MNCIIAKGSYIPPSTLKHSEIFQKELDNAKTHMGKNEFETAGMAYAKVVEGCLNAGAGKEDLTLAAAMRGLQVARFQIMKSIADLDADPMIEGKVKGSAVSDDSRQRKVAQHKVGNVYLEGCDDVSKDEQTAVMYFEKSAAQGYEPATKSLIDRADAWSSCAVNSLIRLASGGLDSAKQFIVSLVRGGGKRAAESEFLNIAREQSDQSQVARDFIVGQAYEGNANAIRSVTHLAEGAHSDAAFHLIVLHSTAAEPTAKDKFEIDKFYKIAGKSIDSVQLKADAGDTDAASKLGIVFQAKADSFGMLDRLNPFNGHSTLSNNAKKYKALGESKARIEAKASVVRHEPSERDSLIQFNSNQKRDQLLYGKNGAVNSNSGNRVATNESIGDPNEAGEGGDVFVRRPLNLKGKPTAFSNAGAEQKNSSRHNFGLNDQNQQSVKEGLIKFVDDGVSVAHQAATKTNQGSFVHEQIDSVRTETNKHLQSPQKKVRKGTEQVEMVVGKTNNLINNLFG